MKSDELRARRRERALLESHDLIELCVRNRAALAVSGDRRLRLVAQVRDAAIELIRAGERDVLDRRHAAPHVDAAIGARDHVAVVVDHIHVRGQRERDADQALREVRELGRRGARIIGIDAVKQRIRRRQARDVLGSQDAVIVEDVAGGTRTTIRARECVLELRAADIAEQGGVVVERGWFFDAADEGEQGQESQLHGVQYPLASRSFNANCLGGDGMRASTDLGSRAEGL